MASIIRRKKHPNAPGLPDPGTVVDPVARAGLRALNAALGTVAARIPDPADQGTSTISFIVLTGRVDQHAGRSVLYGRRLTFENGAFVSQSEEMPVSEMVAGAGGDIITQENTYNNSNVYTGAYWMAVGTLERP